MHPAGPFTSRKSVVDKEEPGLVTITMKVAELPLGAEVGPVIRSVILGGKVPVTVREAVELVDPS